MASSNNSYDLKLPADKMDQFVSNKYQILNESVQRLLAGRLVGNENKSVAGFPKNNYQSGIYKTHTVISSMGFLLFFQRRLL